MMDDIINIYKEIKELREKGVYIGFEPEYYETGVNYIFQIRFFEDKYTTGGYNDNHEFGEVEDVMLYAIKMAKFMISDPKYIKYYFLRTEDLDEGEDYTEAWIKSKEIQKEIMDHVLFIR